MSLATRCTACGTVFRVVQDQLKVSEGWVRCGRCNEVFNALEGLFDLEREAAPAWPSSPADGSVSAGPGETVPSPEAEPLDTGSETLRLDRSDAQRVRSRPGGNDSTPAMRVGERDRLEFPDARFDADAVDADAFYADLRQSYPTDATQAIEPMAPSSPEPLDISLDPDEGESINTATEFPPDFLRYSQRRAQRRSPLGVALWSFAALVLTAALALQGVHHFRDSIAARWPAVAPALVAACGLLHCTVQPPHRIDEITVENSAMTRASAPDAFRFSVGLRNRGPTLLALPSVDLSLTDPSGQVVARRVLSPLDFKAVSGSIAAGADTALQLVFKAENLRVTGYTVEIFYP